MFIYTHTYIHAYIHYMGPGPGPGRQLGGGMVWSTTAGHRATAFRRLGRSRQWAWSPRQFMIRFSGASCFRTPPPPPIIRKMLVLYQYPGTRHCTRTP